MSGLTITSNQWETYEAARFNDFRTFMVKHLRRTGRVPPKAKSDEDILAFVDTGIKRAKTYGATSNDAFGVFIIVMSELGDDFDTDPALPWVKATLTDTSVTDANQRVLNLAAQCGFYLANRPEDAPPGGAPD